MVEDIQETPNNCASCPTRCGKLDVYDWLGDLPAGISSTDVVEVQFKNTRKGYYKNSNAIHLVKGDVVAVEASPGHDIGVITLTGDLVLLQMKKNNIIPASYEFKRVYRKVKPVDVEKWEEAKGLEHETMLESRRIATRLNLNMKIGDVEYQGDRTKAIFYYIADERVDFRELIKLLADRFKIRIEMRQIGARQEAGRIGGIGPCGRELCCSTWMTNFISVTTNSARYQEISLNPQKLAGQCGKLKCCLNYELDAYIDAQLDFPRTNLPLKTSEGVYFHFKTDIFKRLMWYSYESGSTNGLTEVSVDRVKEIIALNRRGIEVQKLVEESTKPVTKEIGYQNVVVEESLTRFDDKSKRNRDRRPTQRNKNNRPQGQPQDLAENNVEVKPTAPAEPRQIKLVRASQLGDNGGAKPQQVNPRPNGRNYNNQQRNRNQKRPKGNNNSNPTQSPNNENE